jgi:hypothetical protein
MSTHECPVVEVKLEPHPNADTLSIVRVFGYTVVVKTEEWKNRHIGAYIPPDYVVPNDERFSFLDGKTRVKVRKFRKVWSQGLLMPAEGMNIGDDVMEKWGISRYEPPLKGPTKYDPWTNLPWWKKVWYWLTGRRLGNTQSERVPDPPGLRMPHYDVESLQRYPQIFQFRESVVVTEKIHGTNARYVFWRDKFYCGSRKEFKKDGSMWHEAVKQNLWIERWCKANPGYALYGEVFGNVQDMTYGATAGQYLFRVFDIWDGSRFLGHEDVKARWANDNELYMNWVPVLHVGEYFENQVRTLADGDSVLYNGFREGVVVRPTVERADMEIGRVQLKLVSNRYLERA